MPSYAKFLKEILSKKRKLKDDETVVLTEECSAIIQKKLPPKLKDPGSFNIPCTIGELNIDKALCDLGASVNLMPLSLFHKLGIGEVKPTMMSLQLADRSIKHPYAIVEDMLVKAEKFILPVDFVVLDMEEDANIPLILGRPFLATSGALIDVPKGELILRVNGEHVAINVFQVKESDPIHTSSIKMVVNEVKEGVETVEKESPLLLEDHIDKAPDVIDGDPYIEGHEICKKRIPQGEHLKLLWPNGNKHTKECGRQKVTHGNSNAFGSIFKPNCFGGDAQLDGEKASTSSHNFKPP